MRTGSKFCCYVVDFVCSGMPSLSLWYSTILYNKIIVADKTPNTSAQRTKNEYKNTDYKILVMLKRL
jgi:hypothetical protein